jgi:hypothetical protein
VVIAGREFAVPGSDQSQMIYGGSNRNRNKIQRKERIVNAVTREKVIGSQVGDGAFCGSNWKIHAKISRSLERTQDFLPQFISDLHLRTRRGR